MGKVYDDTSEPRSESIDALSSGRCGSCGGKIDRLNICLTDHKAMWEFPNHGNLIDGSCGFAIGITCDACADARISPKEVVELRDGQIVYHAVESLNPGAN